MLRMLLKNSLRRRPLIAYRLKRLKQAVTVAKLGLSSMAPFDETFISVKLLERTIDQARKKGSAPPTVFTDSRMLVTHCEKRGVACQYVNGGDFNAPDPAAIRIAVYAINKYSNGRPVIHWLFKTGVPFLPVGVDYPASILTEDANAEAAIRDAWVHQLREGWEKFDLHVGGDFENIFQVIAATKNLDGAYVEIGVFHGSSADAALRYMANLRLSRRCVFIDTFDAFAYYTAARSPDRQWSGTHAEVSQVRTTERLLRHNSKTLRVEVRKADICTPDAMDGVDQIACANIDVDLYEAIIAGADHVIPRLSIGGAVLIEDAGHGVALVGARAALEVILERHPGLFHYLTFSGQHVLVKTALWPRLV